jgi:carboxyl-terminal processing protease
MAYPETDLAAIPSGNPGSLRRKRRDGMRRGRLLLIGAVLVALCGGFFVGKAYTERQFAAQRDPIVTEVTNKEQGQPTAVDFSLFWQVWDRLYDLYADADVLSAQDLVYGAIEGMVAAAGDPYTVFLQPEPAKKFQEDVGGSFSGVGIEIGKRNGGITVIAPIRDTPAWEAGLEAGDVIIAVDEEDATVWTIDEAVDHIRGKRGTTVRLTIYRSDAQETLDFDVVRDTIRIPAVRWEMLENNIAYIQLITFNANATDQFSRAARDLQEAGATALILDLRNNPGGLLDESVQIAGWLLPDDTLVVQERFGDGSTEELYTDGNEALAGLPIVILINGGSASASEILAGALHDIRDIRLVGTTTYGKGSVQHLESFYNGSSLKVTVAKWFTPNGTSINDTGIEPTDELELPDEEPEDGWSVGEPGRDPQLDRALEIIQEIL